MFLNIDSEKGITASDKLNFEDALRLIGTATIALMDGLDKQVKETAPEDTYKEVHGRIYDMYNIMAGNILDAFDNTRSPATDLTAEAILRAENEILDEAVPVVEGLEIKVTEPNETIEESTSPA